MQPLTRIQTVNNWFKTHSPGITNDIVNIITQYDGLDIAKASTKIGEKEKLWLFVKTPEFRAIRDCAAQALSASSDDCNPADKRNILINFCRHYIDFSHMTSCSLSHLLFHEMSRLKLKVNLDKTDLSDLTFENCDLQEMSAVGANLTRTRFWCCKLHDTNFSAAICASTKFCRTYMQRINLTHAQLPLVYFYSSIADGLTSDNVLLNQYLAKLQRERWMLNWIQGMNLEGTFKETVGMDESTPEESYWAHQNVASEIADRPNE